MLITTAKELIPIDYKLSKGIGPHFKLQLMAYGRLLAETYGENEKVVRRGFLYLIPRRKAVEVSFTKTLRRQLQNTIGDLRAIAQMNHFPTATKQRRKCVDCEFRRFCNDVL